MQDKTLIEMFCDGTALDEGQFEYLLDKGLIHQTDHIGYYAYELTNKGKELLNAK
jgi:predicted transcriptional regulator